MPTDTTLIIPQRNGSRLTFDALRTWHRFEPHAAAVLVVDDGSDPAERAAVTRLNWPHLRLIPQPPRGVTAAWNAGVAASRTRYCVLCNNDVLADGPWLRRLVEPLRRGAALITGPEGRTERHAPSARLPDPLLAGWCFAFPRDLWSRLGGFDESLHTYWSDTDFQARTARLEPASLHIVPGLPLGHLGHRTAHTQPHINERWRTDRATFLKKWFHAPTAP